MGSEWTERQVDGQVGERIRRLWDEVLQGALRKSAIMGGAPQIHKQGGVWREL